MRTLHIIDADPSHAAIVAAAMREADQAEVLAIGQGTPLEAAAQSLERSARAWTWVEDGTPLAIFGVAVESFVGGIGRPWLLTSTGVMRHRTRFARLSLHALSRMREVRPRLENWVDGRYEVCLRYLGWLGFTIHPAQPLGPYRVPFHRFEIGVP